ncbi:hypothetical protein KIP88_41380 [Bradyrhizobium sp. SRL28]|uniref:hypothetical protein n=1 Tax=Bradyrhizobium sp. SRL28 TaxID=2836178 RepID=UPI001BDDFD59|nr:hypothetical protein [Bradyrhizobium sp. SRL28]MBT1516857.1 hypothetical protein [Bradyrhizobium sp. SRL28]
MRFVPIKSAGQQATLMLHKTRELLVKQRTLSVNAPRGHLAEFGLGVRVDELLGLAAGDTTPPDAADGRKGSRQQIDALGSALDDLEREITKAHALSETSRSLGELFRY